MGEEEKQAGGDKVSPDLADKINKRAGGEPSTGAIGTDSATVPDAPESPESPAGEPGGDDSPQPANPVNVGAAPIPDQPAPAEAGQKPAAEAIDASVKKEQVKEKEAGAVARPTLANLFPKVIEEAKAIAAQHGGRGAEMICSLLLRS